MKMNQAKQNRLAQKGWRVGDATEFLQLSKEEAAIEEIRLALSQCLKQRREAQMPQVELAAKIGSSQPRVAMAENGSRSVSIDLLLRALLAIGATPKDIGMLIAKL